MVATAQKTRSFISRVATASSELIWCKLTETFANTRRKPLFVAICNLQVEGQPWGRRHIEHSFWNTTEKNDGPAVVADGG